MAEYTENKFIVINPDHLRRAPVQFQQNFARALEALKPFLPNHTYYVCNADEPYGDQVRALILMGEDIKNGELELEIELAGGSDDADDDNGDMGEQEKAEESGSAEATETTEVNEASTDSDNQESSEETPAVQ